MKADLFYERLHAAAAQPPEARRQAIINLHAEVVNEYLSAVRAIGPDAAAGPGSDGRSLAQIVGHIAAWDRYTIIAAGELLAGVHWPRIMEMKGYVDAEGREHEFAGVDEFNAAAAEAQAGLPWETIREDAIQAATNLYTLFIHPNLLTHRLLDATRVWEWRPSRGEVIRLPVGWTLWMVTLEHEAVEHAGDLHAYGRQATRPVAPGE